MAQLSPYKFQGWPSRYPAHARKKEQAPTVSARQYWVLAPQSPALLIGTAVRENIVIYARGLNLLDNLKACAVVLMLGALLGCAAPSASLTDTTSRDATSRDAFNGVRN